MKRDKRNRPLPEGDNEANQARQQTIDMLIDEIGAESFPASDPPAWGVVISRLDQGRPGAQAE